MKNFLQLGLSHGLRPFFALFTNVVIARLLGGEAYGAFVIVWSLSLVIAAIADFGTRNTALVDLSARSFSEAVPFFKWRYQLAVLVFIVGGILLSVLTEHAIGLCLLAAAIGIFDAYADPWLLFCRARNRAEIELRATLVQIVVTLSGLGILIFSDSSSLMKIFAILLAGNIARSLTAGLSLYFSEKVEIRDSNISSKPPYAKSLDLAGTAGVVLMLFFARSPILNGTSGLDLLEVGVLGIFVSLSQLQYVLAGVILSWLIPNENEQSEKLSRSLAKFAVLSVVLSSLLAIFLPLVLSFFGDEFSKFNGQGQLLMMFSAFTCFAYVFTNRLFSYRKFPAMLTILGVFCLIRWMGMFYVESLTQTIWMIILTEVMVVLLTFGLNLRTMIKLPKPSLIC